MIDYARCPKRFYWTAVRPLPRFSGPAARIGTEVHRWIERRATGQATLLEVERCSRRHQRGARRRTRQGRATAGGVPGAAGSATSCRCPPSGRSCCGWRASRSADGSTRSTASPTEPGRSSTGRRVAVPPTTIRSRALQLDLYGLACVEIWAQAPRGLHAHLPLPRERRGGPHPMEDPDVVEGARRSRRCDRSTRARSSPRRGRSARTAISARSVPEGKAWLAANGARRRRYVVSRSICCSNVR